MRQSNPRAAESYPFQVLTGLMLLLLGLVETARGQEHTASGEVVEWLAPYFPPFHKHPGKGEYGYLDRLHNELIEGLPGYRHRFKQANYSRILYNAKLGRSFCSQALIKTPERDPYFHFSQPIIPMLSPGLIVRRDALDRLPGNPSRDSRAVSLVAILNAGFGPIGYLKHRTYSKPVDSILAAHEENPQVNPDWFYASSSNNEVLFRMLSVGRIAGLLGTASELHQLSPDPSTDDAFTFLPLTETPAYSQLHYACTRDERGRKIIEALNARFTALDLRRRAKALYQSTLSPASASRYESVYRRFMAELNHRAAVFRVRRSVSRWYVPPALVNIWRRIISQTTHSG